ncbi:hypothetical protein GH714_043659 [Hevea brasiliensis]|uniref:Uncharacterized protein n=1 Tax=Hevea brasiliensis TaxID=3981 RepID=A0A6A6K530_HEVBR|nr:hypothetical protein GH714_043659 [Hevea brasiliensis]
MFEEIPPSDAFLLKVRLTLFSVYHSLNPRCDPQPWQTHYPFPAYSSLPVHPAKARCIPRLMRLLVHSGFFAQAKISEDDDQEEGYVLTSASQLLLKDNPLSVTPFLMAMLDPILTRPWHYVSTWFLNDDPTPFNTAHGRTLWEYAGHEPKLNDFFNEAMASDARLVMHVLINECEGSV